MLFKKSIQYLPMAKKNRPHMTAKTVREICGGRTPVEDSRTSILLVLRCIAFDLVWFG